MLRRLNRRLLITAVLFIIISGTSLNALDFWNKLQFSTLGSIFILASDNGKQGADPLPILPSLGFSLAWLFSEPLRLEFTEDLYFTNYEYNSELNYPMGCNPENRSAFVMGFVTCFQLTYFLPLGDTGIGIRAYTGQAADLRIVILAFGLNHPDDFTGDIKTDAKLQTKAISDYFWGKGRWFLPVAGIGMDFPLNEKFLLGFDLRTWFPLYRLWTDGDLPKIDGWRFGAGFRITPRL